MMRRAGLLSARRRDQLPDGRIQRALLTAMFVAVMSPSCSRSAEAIDGRLIGYRTINMVGTAVAEGDGTLGDLTGLIG